MRPSASAPHPNVQAELARHDLTVHVATCAGLSGGTSYVLALNASGDHAEAAKASSSSRGAVRPAAALFVQLRRSRTRCSAGYFTCLKSSERP